MKILLGVPAFDERAIFTKCYQSLWEMDKGGHEVIFFPVTGYDCATARNRMVQKTLDEKADYLMMVDSDTVVPRDALVNMLSDNVDVLLGYYAHRDKDNIYRGRSNVCRLYQPDGQKYFNYPLESEYTEDEMHDMRDRGEFLLQIHGGGMGCALIRVDVFRRLKYPWYDWINYADDNRGMLSEDLYFCEQCRFQHIPIYTDTRINCGHILRYEQTMK